MASPFDLMHKLKDVLAVLIGRSEMAAMASTEEAKKRHLLVLRRKKQEAIDLLTELEREWQKRRRD